MAVQIPRNSTVKTTAIGNAKRPVRSQREIDEEKRLTGELAGQNLDPARRARIEARMKYKGYDMKGVPAPGQNPPPPPGVPPTTTTPPPPATTPPATTTDPIAKTPEAEAGMNQDAIMKKIFPDFTERKAPGSSYVDTDLTKSLGGSFMPEYDPNRKVEASPLYQFQKQQGLSELGRLMAARGKVGSGAEVEGNARLLNELGAQEAQRQSTVAQQEADRLARMSEFEAGRTDRASEFDTTRRDVYDTSTSGRVLDMQRDEQQRRERERQQGFEEQSWAIDRMLGQSPMSMAYDATSSTADLEKAYGKDMAKYLQSLYGKVFAGGGGGGTPIAPFIPPNMGGISAGDLSGALAGGSNNTQLWDALLKGLGRFGG